MLQVPESAVTSQNVVMKQHDFPTVTSGNAIMKQSSLNTVTSEKYGHETAKGSLLLHLECSK